MATCSFIRERKQTIGAMNGVLRYVTQEQKITDANGIRYLTGVNCAADLAFQCFMATKNLYGQAKGVFFYQYVQSFSPEEQVTPAEAHQIALELTERFFPGCEVLVATHVDAAHIHSHFVVNSVGPDTGKKLHFTPRTLETMRQLSDQICREHGLTVLKPYRQKAQVKGLRPGEYRSALQGKSWKFRLIAEIEAAMERTGSREDFIQEMRRRGYGVRWEAGRKAITYTTPTGMKCRDDKLHEEKFRKEKMEDEFRIRTAQQYVGQAETTDPAAAQFDGAADQHSLHHAKADAGAAGDCPAEDAGASGAHPRGDGISGNAEKFRTAGYIGASGEVAESDGRTESGAVPLDPAAVRTGWEEARRIYQKAVRHGGDFSEELGWETAGTGKEQLQDHPEFGGNFDAGQYPAVDPAEIADDVLRLIRELERSENLEIQDATTRHVTRERKALAKERELKIAMGNQADDHEEQKMM